jgi:hypothetical protein
MDPVGARLQHAFEDALVLATVSTKDEPALADYERSVASLERSVDRVRQWAASEAVWLRQAKALEATLRAQRDALLAVEAAMLAGGAPGPASAVPQPPPPPPQQQQLSVLRAAFASANENDSSQQGEAPLEEEADAKKKPKRRAKNGPPPLAPLTSEEFEAVPSYIRGRLTLERVNAAVKELEELLASKYEVLAMPMARMNEKTLAAFKSFKNQETNETRGVFFFSDLDLPLTKHVKPDASGRALLTLLRTVGRIRNARGSAPTRYIVCE